MLIIHFYSPYYARYNITLQCYDYCMSDNHTTIIFTYYSDLMIRFWLWIIWILLAAYFWKRRSNNKPDTHEWNTEYIRTYNPSYKKSIIIKAVDWDKNHRTRWIAIWLLFIWLLLSWCSNIESQVNSQIQESEKVIIEKQRIIDDATKEKQKNEKIKQAWLAYLNALKWWEDTNTTWTHATAEIPEKVTTVSTIWYGKCIDPEWVETVWEFKYENYIKNESCWYFAWTEICYESKKEKCIIFENQEKYEERLIQ